MAKDTDGTWLALGAVALVGGAKLAADRLGSRNDSDDDEENDEPSDEDEDFDLKSELESGFVIGDARGGYALSVEGRYLDTIPHEVPVRGRFGRASEETLSGWDVALRTALQWMEDKQYWPNLFHVNERGNVDLLDSSHRARKVGGKTFVTFIKGKTGEIVRSWV
jgi:hypothetical protein